MNIQISQILKGIGSGQFGSKDGNSILAKLAGSSLGMAVPESGKKDGFDITVNVMEFLDPTSGMSEEEKEAYQQKIMQKLKNGDKLTSEELNYLRAKDPVMYAQAARVQNMRENLKSQLEHCRSKEEVEDAYGMAVSMVGKEDPMKEALVAAYHKVAEEFKGTEKYQSLPDHAEDEKQKK